MDLMPAVEVPVLALFSEGALLVLVLTEDTPVPEEDLAPPWRCGSTRPARGPADRARRAGVGGAGAAGPRQAQPGHRPRTAHQRVHGEVPRGVDPGEAGRQLTRRGG